MEERKKEIDERAPLAAEMPEETRESALMRGLTSAVAEFYRRDRRDQIQRGLLRRVRHGLAAGRLPAGYHSVVRVVDGRGYRRAAPDPRLAPHVRWAFEAFAQSEMTARAIGLELARRGLGSRTRHTGLRTPWSSRQVKAMLRNPFYQGHITFRGDRYPGLHTPLVSEELFQRVQARLEPSAARSEVSA